MCLESKDRRETSKVQRSRFKVKTRRAWLGLVVSGRRHIDRHVHAMVAAAQKYPLDGANVAVIAAPRKGHVAKLRHLIVGGVEIEPAALLRRIDRQPRVRSVATDKLRLSRWRL